MVVKLSTITTKTKIIAGERLENDLEPKLNARCFLHTFLSFRAVDWGIHEPEQVRKSSHSLAKISQTESLGAYVTTTVLKSNAYHCGHKHTHTGLTALSPRLPG